MTENISTGNPRSLCDDGPAPDLAELARKMEAEGKVRPARQLFTITDAAAARVKELLAARGKPSAGIKIGVRAKGCSGLSYNLEYADEITPGDEMVEDKGITLLIDPKATLFVIGTEMDYKKEELAEGFIFTNPNEKGRCGCGESFHV